MMPPHLQEESQLGVTVRYMCANILLLYLHQRLDNPAQRTQAAVDLGSLLEVLTLWDITHARLKTHNMRTAAMQEQSGTVIVV